MGIPVHTGYVCPPHGFMMRTKEDGPSGKPGGFCLSNYPRYQVTIGDPMTSPISPMNIRPSLSMQLAAKTKRSSEDETRADNRRQRAASTVEFLKEHPKLFRIYETDIDSHLEKLGKLSASDLGSLIIQDEIDNVLILLAEAHIAQHEGTVTRVRDNWRQWRDQFSSDVQFLKDNSSLIPKLRMDEYQALSKALWLFEQIQKTCERIIEIKTSATKAFDVLKHIALDETVSAVVLEYSLNASILANIDTDNDLNYLYYRVQDEIQIYLEDARTGIERALRSDTKETPDHDSDDRPVPSSASNTASHSCHGITSSRYGDEDDNYSAGPTHNPTTGLPMANNSAFDVGGFLFAASPWSDPF